MPDSSSIPLPDPDRATYAWVSRTQEAVVFRHAGTLTAFSAICPHMGARLELDARQGCLRCPWHGLEFSLAQGVSTHPRYPRLKRLVCRETGGTAEVGSEGGVDDA